MPYNPRIEQAVSATGGYIDVFPRPIEASRAPTSTDVALQGQTWIHKSDNAVYFYTGNQWINASGAAGAFDSLTVTPDAFSYTGVGSAFTMTSDTASTIGVTGAGIDLTLSSAAGSVFMTANEASADAINIQSNSGGAVLNLGDDAGTYAFAITNDSDATVASISSTGEIAGTNLNISGGAQSKISSSLASSDEAVLIEATASDSSIKVKLGDNAAGTFFTVTDSDDTDVITVDSNGNLSALSLTAEGDPGSGTVSTTAVTNVIDNTLSSGDLSIKSKTANPGDNAGFIKAYVGTTVVWIPYFDNISP